MRSAFGYHEIDTGHKRMLPFCTLKKQFQFSFLKLCEMKDELEDGPNKKKEMSFFFTARAAKIKK